VRRVTSMTGSGRYVAQLEIAAESRTREPIAIDMVQHVSSHPSLPCCSMVGGRWDDARNIS
jgi:hypothetical protein